MGKTSLAEKINRIAEATGKITTGINHVFVEHESGCPALKTHSLLDCVCNPSIRIKNTLDA